MPAQVAKGAAQGAADEARLLVFHSDPDKECLHERSDVDVSRMLDLVGRLAPPVAVGVVDALDTKESLTSDLALEHDGCFPQASASVDPASDFQSPILDDDLAVGRAKQDVVDALGVGLHVPVKALEHLSDGGAGFTRRELEEDVVAVRELYEEMRAPARLALLVFPGNGLDRDAGGVGGQAERAGEGFLLGGFNHRRTRGGAGIFQPAAHGASVDGSAFAAVAVFQPVKR